jgi:hypothetical protein
MARAKFARKRCTFICVTELAANAGIRLKAAGFRYAHVVPFGLFLRNVAIYFHSARPIEMNAIRGVERA